MSLALLVTFGGLFVKFKESFSLFMLSRDDMLLMINIWQACTFNTHGVKLTQEIFSEYEIFENKLLWRTMIIYYTGLRPGQNYELHGRAMSVSGNCPIEVTMLLSESLTSFGRLHMAKASSSGIFLNHALLIKFSLTHLVLYYLSFFTCL